MILDVRVLGVVTDREYVRILLDSENGVRTELGKVIDRIRARARKVRSLYLLATIGGQPLNRWTLRIRFDPARKAAAEKAVSMETEEMIALAERIRQFQFRDIRPKAASEMGDIHAVSKLLGHSEQEITK